METYEKPYKNPIELRQQPTWQSLDVRNLPEDQGIHQLSSPEVVIFVPVNQNGWIDPPSVVG